MIKVAVLFGGKSSEHNVSIVSGTSIIESLEQNKYEIYPVYITKNGDFYKYNKNVKDIKMLTINSEVEDIELIPNIIDYLKKVDVIFPVLHGLYGEDGTIQGLFELIGKPYVGCGVLSSSLCMDKIYTKILLERAKIETSKGIYLKKYQDKYIYIDEEFNKQFLNLEELKNLILNKLGWPIFIKPSRQGSSVGVNKVSTEIDLLKYLEEAFLYDTKILIESEIIGREVECAVLGNEELIVSNVGEVLSAEEFYTYDSKYNNEESKTIIPADLDNELVEQIQLLAKKAYAACDCSGLARIDFFIEKNTNRIIINEINTLPGFTSISMYPKLIENIGISREQLLDNLINLAMQKV